MIQIVFTDNGKVHTVTFSGDSMEYWAAKFINLVSEAKIYNFEIRHI